MANHHRIDEVLSRTTCAWHGTMIPALLFHGIPVLLGVQQAVHHCLLSPAIFHHLSDVELIQMPSLTRPA